MEYYRVTFTLKIMGVRENIEYFVKASSIKAAHARAFEQIKADYEPSQAQFPLPTNVRQIKMLEDE